MSTQALNRGNILVSLTRPIWDDRLRGGLVGFGVGAALGAVLPWGLALVVVPLAVWGSSLAVERAWK